MLRSGRLLARFALVALVICARPPRTVAQATQNRPSSETVTVSASDLRDLRLQVTALQKQVEEVKNLLASQRAALPVGASRSPSQPPNVNQKMTLPFVPEQTKGSAKAPFVLVEFSDPQCPFCIDFAKHTLPTFDQAYIASGKIRLLSVEFPLESHPDAEKLSLASLCAGEQGKYWQMHDALMNAKPGQANDAISAARAELGLDDQAFSKCTASSASTKSLDGHVEAAKAAGVYSTPTFLLGRVENGAVHGVTLIGDLPPEQFSKQVEAAIATLQGGNDDQKSKK